MPRALFEELLPRHRESSRWRALPLSMALHALAAAAIATLVVRPIVNADEEGPTGVVRFVPDLPAPIAVAPRPPAQPRRHAADAAAFVHAPSLPVIDPEPPSPASGVFDDTPPLCLTNCGDASLANTGAGPYGTAGGGTGRDGPPGNRGPLPIGGDLRPPRKTHHVLPEYPELARRVGLGGLVIVQCVSDAEGHVSDARVLRGHPLLDAAALHAVRQWRYQPTRLNGQAVPVVMTVRVTFISPR